MIIITAVDDNNGLLFNHRRQSRDVKLREKIYELTQQGTLWMNTFSAKQFAKYENVRVDEAFLQKAGQGEFCFVEDQYLLPFADKIETLYLFKWNRAYPADFCLDIDLNDTRWKLTGTEEFVGKSHKIITMEVYTNEKM